MSKIKSSLMLLICLLFISGVSSFAQESTQKEKTKLEQNADEQTLTKLKAVSEKHAQDITTKLGLNDNKKEEIRESIWDYFDDRWESRVELDQESGDKEEMRENNEDLADERVELSKEIESELTDAQKTQWDTMKVEFWTNLDADFFKVRSEALQNAGEMKK